MKNLSTKLTALVLCTAFTVMSASAASITDRFKFRKVARVDYVVEEQLLTNYMEGHSTLAASYEVIQKNEKTEKVASNEEFFAYYSPEDDLSLQNKVAYDIDDNAEDYLMAYLGDCQVMSFAYDLEEDELFDNYEESSHWLSE